MNDQAMEIERDAAMEVDTDADEVLGDGTKSKRANWIDPDSQP